MEADSRTNDVDEFGLPRVPIQKKLGEPVVTLEHIYKRTWKEHRLIRKTHTFVRLLCTDIFRCVTAFPPPYICFML